MNNFAPLEMSVRQGAKLWNIAPNTIYDRIRKKELQLNENGKITPSEMSRVLAVHALPKKFNEQVKLNNELHKLNPFERFKFHFLNKPYSLNNNAIKTYKTA